MRGEEEVLVHLCGWVVRAAASTTAFAADFFPARRPDVVRAQRRAAELKVLMCTRGFSILATRSIRYWARLTLRLFEVCLAQTRATRVLRLPQPR